MLTTTERETLEAALSGLVLAASQLTRAATAEHQPALEYAARDLRTEALGNIDAAQAALASLLDAP